MVNHKEDTDSQISINDLYTVLNSLVIHSENIRWTRLNTYLVVASVTLAAWAAIFAGTAEFQHKSLVLFIVCIPSIILGAIWAVLGRRSSCYLDNFHNKALLIENSLPDTSPKPFNSSETIRKQANKSIFKMTTSKNIVTYIPIMFSVFFILLSLGPVTYKIGSNFTKIQNPKTERVLTISENTMINWESVLTSIGSTTTIVLILGFVARSLFKHILKSGLETHKISLKAEFDQKLADLNNSFSLLALEHKVRFSKLHEERAEVIEVLYSNLIDYLDKLTKYFQSGVVGSEGTDQHNEIRNEFSTLRHEYYSKKKIYFTEDLNVIIQKAFETIWKSVADATLFKSNIIEGSDAHIEAFKRANNELQSTGDISKMLNALEKEFRLLLGSVKP